MLITYGVILIMPKISICIPCYEMNGMGVKYLHVLMSSIIIQTYKNYEIIITDHSTNVDIEKYLRTTYTDSGIKINYIRHGHKRGNSSANTNMAIKYALGEIIKPMFQDDMFYDINCLEKIVREYDRGNVWGAVGFNHISRNNEIYVGTRYKPQYPIYNDYLLEGKNTFGCPSVVYFKNDKNFFDEELIWLMDCEMFHSLNKKYGLPKIIEEYLISVRIWESSVSARVRNDTSITIKEKNYVLSKHSEYILDPNPEPKE